MINAHDLSRSAAPSAPPPHSRRRHIGAALALTLASAAIVGCSSGSSTNPTGTPTSGGSGTTSSAAPAPGSPVLPVTSNPISNTSTTQALTIDTVLVENNVDQAGNAATDHLEIAMTNTGTVDLTAFEVYYTFADPKTGDTEGYYAELPASFTIAPGAQRAAHFDNTGEADHFPVNEFSLYYTDVNALDVTVEVSATDTATQTATTTKDAGGPETAD
ncbi:hypothetical protein NPS01_33050 [Nocardioides psychrotolerans]|uniref:Uncharacterized protein n=1 Tax=Nocardioides psychrotolerans TaxID=1005945 RepID=A0A1I3PBQ3_9ACTN|nr:hypothetical protein [Nocardioides psychrotolerans]GEP39642.1 hypothetical protein NPS01_33050 [Nocardioides psychrotolerans]SFJ19024.1 hypothetical protein SAMN05216561_12035 [Nocardioides psychrotolerans]